MARNFSGTIGFIVTITELWNWVPEYMVIRIQHGTEPDKSVGIQGVPEFTPGYCTSFIKLHGYSKWSSGYNCPAKIRTKFEKQPQYGNSFRRWSTQFQETGCVCIPELKVRIKTAIETITADMLQTVWNELDYRVDVCRITKGAHIEPCKACNKNLQCFSIK